jgi:alpha-N-arabinofuranosidase
MINTTWGKVVENNHFGTHEFFDLVELLHTKAYVCGNVGSGSVQEMMEWVEYMTSGADSPVVNPRRANGRDKPWKLDYFGVGNESWGCGGNMRPEYYADLYRRYNTFVKNYGPDRIYRIACGANDFDLNWTEVMMKRAGSKMDGLSLHYYTLPTGSWKDKGPATGFGEEAYHATLARAWKMKSIIEDHEVIMDKYDPEQQVGLIVDEWGVWTNVEPGTNRAFLYQQNSLRDAIVAALHFQFFHEHADRIRMANIAQTVNVLQAMILTDGPRMLRTPTYWVFEMHKVHQGGNTVPLEVETSNYMHGEESIPQVSATATRNPETGALHLSLVNTDPGDKAVVKASLEGLPDGSISGRLLTAEKVDSHNTFDSPDSVRPVSFEGASINERSLHVVMPPKSIVVLAIQE